MPHDPYQALYFHIPFCKSRCLYCDFATKAIDESSVEIDEYLDDMILSLRRYSKEGELGNIKSIYIGGGTPTHMGNARLVKLAYAIGLSVNLSDDTEFTIEANPESINENLIKDIWALGVNRLSVGVQSFDDAILRRIGRVHDSAGADDAIRTAMLRFDNVSIDLMCGLPGQTTEMLLEDIEYAIDLGVKHVSLYPLSVEDHTPYANKVLSGELPTPDDDVQAIMMQRACDALESQGFFRYEVSNFAKPGYESKHNSSYWSGVPYLGIGFSAVTMTQNDQRRCRVQNDRVIDDLDRFQMAAEDAMLAMRMTKGLNFDRVRSIGMILPDITATLEDLETRGFVKRTSDSWVPTEMGWLLGNELYGELLSLAP